MSSAATEEKRNWFQFGFVSDGLHRSQSNCNCVNLHNWWPWWSGWKTTCETCPSIVSCFVQHRRRHDSAPRGTLSLPLRFQQPLSKQLQPLFLGYLKKRRQNWLRLRSITYNITSPQLQKLFSMPALSAPVERVFSHDGIIIMRPYRARLGDGMLSALVFSKCNEHINV